MLSGDWRIGAWLSIVRRAAESDTIDHLHAAIEHEIGAALERIEALTEDSAVDDELYEIEDLLGLAFVAAQTFITHVRTRIELFEDSCKHRGISLTFATNKQALLGRGEPLRTGVPWSAIDVINAVANYLKHEDEWTTAEEKQGTKLIPVWNPTHTVNIVTSIGMKPSFSGNLRTAAEALGVVDFKDLSPLRKKLREWAGDLYKAASKDVGLIESRAAPLQRHR